MFPIMKKVASFLRSNSQEPEAAKSGRDGQSDHHQEPDANLGHIPDIDSGIPVATGINEKETTQRESSERKRRRRRSTNASSDIGRNEEAEKLARDVERLKKKLQSTKDELAETHQQLTKYKDKNDTLWNENNHFRRNIEGANREMEMAQQQTWEYQQQINMKEKENTLLRDNLRISETKIDEMTKLLQERKADLKGVQTFLTTADLYSGAEIIQMVEALNADIFQLATFVAELIEDETMVASDEERIQNLDTRRRYLDIISETIGTELYTHLANEFTQIREDPLPLQLAIQSYLACWCTLKIRVFAAERQKSVLDDLYKRIKSHEAQAVSGRWRAITSAQIQDSDSDRDVKTTVRIIQTLLCLCGWSSSDTRSNKSITTIQDMLFAIVKQWDQLKKAIHEGITTADMEVFIHNPGVSLDDTMDDIYRDSVNDLAECDGKANLVLCTVGLGLRKSVTNRGERLESRKNLLLKPKVARSTVLLDMDDSVNSDKDGYQVTQDVDMVMVSDVEWV